MKKKILTLALTVALLITLTFSLTSCLGPQTFTVGEFSIDLNITYFDMTSIVPMEEDIDATYAAYISIPDAMVVIPTKAPNPNNYSLMDYVDAYSDDMGGSISKTEDGIYTITYTESAEGVSFSIITYVYEVEDGFWAVAFMSLSGDISEKSELIEGYVDTIVIE